MGTPSVEPNITEDFELQAVLHLLPQPLLRPNLG